MACYLIARGMVTGDCSTWVSGAVNLGEISPEALIPSQSSRTSTGCPAGYPLYQAGVQMNPLVGFDNSTYSVVTWQSPPTLSKEGDCTPAPTYYDCINGACTPKTTYNTPGLYQSLEECEVNCGTEGCSGKCISNSEWSQIESLSNQLKSKNCS